MQSGHGSSRSLIFLVVFFMGNASVAAESAVAKSEECQISQPMISLSAPVTRLLSELKLLDSPKLLAISSHHLLKDEKSSAIEFSAGQFFSQKVLRSLLVSNPVVFFDESQEIERKLKNIAGLKSLEIISRGKRLIDLNNQLFKLMPLKNCNSAKLIQRLQNKILELSKLPPIKNSILFLLGDLAESKGSIWVHGQDGLPILLKSRVSFFKTTERIDAHQIANQSLKKMIPKTRAGILHLVSLLDSNKEDCRLPTQVGIEIKRGPLLGLKYHRYCAAGTLLPGFHQIDLVFPFYKFLQSLEKK